MTGSVTLRCTARGGVSRLTETRYDGLARASRAQRDGAAARVVLAHLGPGVIGGDRYAFAARVDESAELIVRGQMATPVYARDDPSSTLAVWQVERDASLVVHPEPLLLDRGAQHVARTDAALAAGARLILAELVSVAAEAQLRLRTTVRIDDRLVVRDACDLRGSDGAIATLIAAGGDAAWRETVRGAAVEAFARHPELRAGVGDVADAIVVRASAARIWPLARAIDAWISRSRPAYARAS